MCDWIIKVLYAAVDNYIIHIQMAGIAVQFLTTTLWSNSQSLSPVKHIENLLLYRLLWDTVYIHHDILGIPSIDRAQRKKNVNSDLFGAIKGLKLPTCPDRSSQ